MNSGLISFVVLVLVGYVAAVSQPIIPNTRAEGCNEGTCGSHCAWDGAKIFPNDNLNQPGKCRMLACSSDFSVRITNCPFDSKNISKL
jgi:hypothetical protein